MPRRLIALAATAAIIVALVGCAASPSPAPVSTPEEPTPTAAAGTSTTPVRAMTIEEKRQLIAPNFKAEVPVPFGDVIKAEAQGDTAWDYEMVVDASVPALASWYQDTYESREWQLIDQTAPTVGSLTLTLTKNAAETRLTITPTAEGKARVIGIVGVGAPVLQTQ